MKLVFPFILDTLKFFLHTLIKDSYDSDIRNFIIELPGIEKI